MPLGRENQISQEHSDPFKDSQIIQQESCRTLHKFIFSYGISILAGDPRLILGLGPEYFLEHYLVNRRIQAARDTAQVTPELGAFHQIFLWSDVKAGQSGEGSRQRMEVILC